MATTGVRKTEPAEGADGFLVPLAYGSRRGENAACAEGVSGADERAEVAGVLQAGGDEEQRSRSGGQRVVEGPERRDEERGETLRRLRVDDAVEDLVGELEELDAMRGPARRGTALADEDGLEGQAGAHRLEEKMLAFDSDESSGEASVSGEGGAELLDAGVGAAGDEGGERRHLG